jgi:hypothetical protein
MISVTVDGSASAHLCGCGALILRMHVHDANGQTAFFFLHVSTRDAATTSSQDSLVRPPNPMTPRWEAVPRHRPWRDTIYCSATVRGFAKKGYFYEFVLLRVYFLNYFRS